MIRTAQDATRPSVVRAVSLVACALAQVACGGGATRHYGADDPTHGIEAPPPPPPPETVEEVPSDIVLRAARPFHGERTADGEMLGKNAFLSELGRADAICIGERHDSASDHYAQLAVLRGLIERQEVGGFDLGVGLEMFDETQQPALDRFSAGRITLEQLVTESGYEARWGFPIQYYAPQLETARSSKNPLLALNVQRALTRAVAEKGLDDLPPDVRKRLPELHLDSAEHRALFDALMEGHPEPHGAAPASSSKPAEGATQDDSIDRMYAAQVVWDEAMANRAAQWLLQRKPARKLLIFAGQAHCHREAIPARIERRGVTRVVSVLPVHQSGDREVPAARAVPADPHAAPDARAAAPASAGAAEAALRAGYDYYLVFE